MYRNMMTLMGFVFSFTSSSVLAVELQKEGSYDHDECWVGDGATLTHSDKAMAGSFKAYGISAGAKPGSLYHNVTGTCVGSWTLIDGEYNETSACEYVDAAKDKFFGIASRKNDEGTWRVVGGTGKYVGLINTSRWKPTIESPQPDGHVVTCLRDTGTWKLK